MTTTTNTKTATAPKPLSATQVCIEIMNELKSKPMVDVVKAMTTSVVNRKGTKFSVAEATTAYRYLVKNGKAPGTIEKLTIVRAPKAAKAPKVKAAPKTSNADHLERLKAAAKKAGIHRDSLTVKDSVVAQVEAPATDDTLGLAAPDSLSMSDLKSVL